MIKNRSTISNRLALTLLVIMVSSLLNLCLFIMPTKAAAPTQPQKLDFAYNNDGACAAAPAPEPRQIMNRQAAPMPKCCLAQNRNFNAVVNTANDKSTPIFLSLIILQSNIYNFEDNSSIYASQLVHPPPALLALASTIIRE